MTEQLRAALYARYSSDIQKDTSIEDQFAADESLAKRENLKVVAKFSDHAKTGATLFGRDGLIDCMQAAKAKKFDVLIVFNLERLARDQGDLDGLHKRLEWYGVKILTVTEGPVTKLHVGIRGLVGSLFLTDLANNVRKGFNGLVRKGKIPGAIAYGYRAIHDKPGEREIDPEQAKIVRRIFSEYASGKPPSVIALGLTRDGIPNASGKPVWSNQIFTHGSHARGIISNRIYIGEIVWNQFRSARNPETGRRGKRPADPHDLIVTQVPHLCIIDQELWDAANRVRAERAVKRPGKPKGTAGRTDYLLSGLLKCAECGSPMCVSAGAVARKNARVICRSAHWYRACKHTHSYDLQRLELGVSAGLREHLIDPAGISETIKTYHSEWAEPEKKTRIDRDGTTKRLNRVTVQIDRLVTAIEGGGNIPALVARLKPLEDERAGLEDRLRTLQSDNVVSLHPAAIEVYKANVVRLHKALISSKPLESEDRVAFRNLIDSIVVHPTGKRRPYEFSVYGRLSAILGGPIFPTAARSAEQILEEAGLSHITVTGTPRTQSTRYRNKEIVQLGRWEAA